MASPWLAIIILLNMQYELFTNSIPHTNSNKWVDTQKAAIKVSLLK